MDFRFIKEIIYSDEYVRFGLREHNELMQIVEKLKLPLLSKIVEFYGDNVRYGVMQLDDLLGEIDEVCAVLRDPDSIKLLNELKKLIQRAKEDKKPIQVLTE